MILEIGLVIFIIVDVVGSYVIWNLMKKTEMLETWVEDFSAKVMNVSDELKEIDATGHFEADDEIGTIFTGIQEIIKDLQETLGEEVDAT